MGLVTGAASGQSAVAAALPDAPSTLLASTQEPQTGAAPGGTVTLVRPKRALRPCHDKDYAPGSRPGAPPLQGPPPCLEENPLQPFVSSKRPRALSSQQKGLLAVRDFVDPFNLMTIAGYSGVAVAANAHSPYGPGFAGFGRLMGYGLAQDAQGEFFGTYAIPSLVHQDPRYHRMPEASISRRVLHAVAHTVVTSRDDGSAMPNYATLLTYPISAELSNLYVPGIQRDIRSTGKRVAIGLATDPAGAVIAEFLPDVARRIHVRIVVVQEILNQLVIGAPSVQ
ncbi:MAG TPA: hypothetical protein VM865_09435 [Acidobacteriaceae bacterium]|nr:hypothetical protein [Acidobacteriaceae bacterium]